MEHNVVEIIVFKAGSPCCLQGILVCDCNMTHRFSIHTQSWTLFLEMGDPFCSPLLILCISCLLPSALYLWSPLRSAWRGRSMTARQDMKAEATKPLSPVEVLEKRAQRRVEISVDESRMIHSCDQQERSPLFALLPRELRNMIWAYATAPFEDPSRRFEATACYFRPDHTASLKTTTALLSTCRRIWLESHAMPMLQAEHCFYYHRPAPDRRDKAWMANLTERNRQDFGHLHLFAQMYATEGLNDRPGHLRSFFLNTPLNMNDFQPRMLHMTLRHADWWYWESDAQLESVDRWIKPLLNSPDLRSTETLRLELETLDYTAEQLEAILERTKALVSAEKETHMVDGKPTKTIFQFTGMSEVHTWQGPPNINNQSSRPYDGVHRLKYYVATLTWKLRFMGHPRGHIPCLRRLPRIISSASWVPAADRLHRMYVAAGSPRSFMLSRGRNAVQLASAHLAYQQIQDIMRQQAESTESIRREHFFTIVSLSNADTDYANGVIEGTLLVFVD
nr:hypothetical protein CFP56_63404 [Quercus suber]POE94752.1 hypothetical protein CFP56_16989 [Quercus suber]